MQLPEFLRTFGMDDVDPEYNPLFKGFGSFVFVLSCLVLSCLVLSCLVLSCHALSCLGLGLWSFVFGSFGVFVFFGFVLS
jgi:hypothetical protein